MLRKLVLLPLLAVQVSCDLLAERMIEGHGEIEMFSRDAPLQARDLEHADLHGVNLTEMYRHARIKRDDGDHIILYVDRAYQDVDGPSSVDPRSLIGRGSRLTGNSGYVRDGSRKDNCFRHNRRDWTSDNSPFSGGVLSLKQWGEANDGYFPYSVTNTDWRWLVVAGSNSGANAGYRARVNAHEWTGSAGIGSRDLRADADAAYSWRKLYNGRWRAASWGTENCAYLYGTTLGFHYEVATWHATV